MDFYQYLNLEFRDTEMLEIIEDDSFSGGVLRVWCPCLLPVRNSYIEYPSLSISLVIYTKTHEKMLNITHYQRNANQNHNEVPLHASQDGCYPKVYKQ